MHLKGDRVLIRPFTAADAPAYLALAQDPLVAGPAGMRPIANLEEAKAHVLKNQTTEFALVVNGEVVGEVGIYPRTADAAAPEARTREIGYALAQSYWGQGLMREALRLVIRELFTQRMTALWAATFPDNQRSIALLARLGFEYRFTVPLPAGLHSDGPQSEAYFELVNHILALEDVD
ncbi:MAG: GNAT family N-acetyltransferase [Lactobacillus sp.]|uniref:GNAT family N-acetyltransferase n=1 Tax=Lacticaseibacillus suilingensis TaxID=2799577 RepID=A0ABW4BKM9_9LACO|nr:GNAT family N-acetyltransferase [Lacticaseibacillus suilingensis]MCI1894726.1 GNAT family N-acetyltransferase [Lactobacillus sp.]MCI1942366.1 GNAT family N-acetyltransferase [Lactobacillus sp.]MCI1972778.1 GNAT family N-acetyltransferase [Lactobacillus sp.]MCI2016438.1 GNAT family N-acetyltransferase [Lactobacillus sp.]MCI2037388.1 GNAT family N-acetyltransferase [Lactobacillus sp.]